MTKQELQMFMIEYAMLSLKAECKTFSEYYDTNLFSVEYELKDDTGIAYLITPHNKTLLATIKYEDVPDVLHHVLSYTGKPFNDLVEEYNLEPKEEYKPQIVINPEATNE